MASFLYDVNMSKTELKIHILYEFNDGPWGGANQFLKAIRNEFIRKGVYTENIEEAQIVLINSFNAYRGFKKLYELRKQYKDKCFVHRVDGPVFLIRGHNKCIDKGIFKINSKLADATIYQTEWSKRKCFELGMRDDKKSVVIKNSPDKSIFFEGKKEDIKNEKKKIVASSWSNNWNKGFKYYQYLDEHLDINKYEFIFVGNSPVEFKNATYYPPKESVALAEILRSADVYLTASKNDPCSNSLIEALACGLPAVVLKDGGHPEIIDKGGKTFENEEEMLKAIEDVCENYNYYKKNIPLYDIKDTSEEYIRFFKEVIADGCRKERVSILLVWYMKGCNWVEKYEDFKLRICKKLFRKQR